MSKNNQAGKKSRLFNPFNMLFNRKKQDDILVEAKIDTPLVTIINTFKGNRTAMAAFYVYILIALIVFIGPFIMPMSLGFTESSQVHIPPTMDLMSVPKALDNNTQEIVIGPKFSFGIAKDGNVYVWGDTKITNTIDIANLPANMGKVVKIAVGADHALALNDQGQVFAWGSNRLQQAKVPMEVQTINNVKDIYAGFQCSIVLTEDGKTIFFGNQMVNDFNAYHPYQGQVEKIVQTADAFAALLKDGSVVFLGNQQTTFSKIPEDMGTVVGLTSTANVMIALNDEGKVFVWGNASGARNEKVIPDHQGKIITVDGGQNHIVATTDTGEVLAWGDNYYKQCNVPAELQGQKGVAVYTGAFQNYAVDQQGKIVTWGLKGYLMGTDELGRDTFTRLIHGGRMTMTIGVVAVVISSIIGIILGGLSGYFGGWVDMLVQRVGEIINALPTLPLIMIVSGIIGNRLDSMQKIYMIMVLLGCISWVGMMRLVRAQVFSIREQEYVTAARAVGVTEMGIVFKHIVPNAVSMIVVSVTLGLAGSLITESALSFLGFGVQAPHPTWGNMLNGARNSVVIQNYWWRWVYPSIALASLVIAINLIGDGIQQAIDPKSQER